MKGIRAVSRRTFIGATGATFLLRTSPIRADPSRSEARDIRSFGAAGDGSQNDTPAFAAAMRAGTPIYVPAGTYLLEQVTIPSRRTILTEGYSTIFRQRRGTAPGTRLLNVVGSNVEIGDCTVEGNIDSDAGEQHHGIFVGAAPEIGNLTDIVIGNIRGHNLRGDVVYIGSANGAVAKRVRIGKVYGVNVLRNVVSIVGGVAITVEAVAGSAVGYAHLDIEPDGYNGPVVGCTIGSVHGNFVQIAGQTIKSYVDEVRIGLLNLAGECTQSVPEYKPGLARADALTLRNVRSLDIGRFIAQDFKGAAIRQIWNPGGVPDQRVHIAAAELSNDCRDEPDGAYINGSPRATRLSIDSLSTDTPPEGVDVVRDCKEARIGQFHGRLRKGRRLIASSPDDTQGLLYLVGGGVAIYGLDRLRQLVTR